MRRLRVLLIQDDEYDATLVRPRLDECASEVISVSKLDDAFEYLDEVDVALLDLPAPREIPALEALHNDRPVVPIVVLARNWSDDRALATLQAGAQECVDARDLTSTELARSLSRAFERGELLRRIDASLNELERQRASVLALSQSKNDLIAVLAHDIKGPLTSIVGFAELLEDGFLEGDAAVDAARTIRTNAQRLATLANDVLALSRVEHGALDIADERVDLNAVLRDVIELHAAERAIELESDVDEPIVRGDQGRLKQAFENLIRNAIKYSPNGEPVRVKLSMDGEAIVISIADRGIGIPSDEIASLFDRFTRGSNARKAKISGTGIGLFIVKTIVDRHGGRIAVASTGDAGSVFEVRLPSVDAAESARPRRVTILTRDAALGRFIAYELRTRGYRVSEADNVGAALAGVRNGDVIVADDGMAMPAEVRASLGADRPVHLVTLGGRRDAAWDAYVPKPFLVADLLAAVDVPADPFVRQ